MRQFAQDRYRVIQWATGNRGRFALRMIADPGRPHLELDADCIIYSGFYPDIDLFCRVLEAGKNVGFTGRLK